MKNGLRYTLFVAMLFAFVGSSANAAEFTRLGAFGGAGFTAVRASDATVSANRESGPAMGASVEAAMTEDFGLETGIVSVNNRVQVPLFARLWGGKVFTAAAGPIADGIGKGTFAIGFGLAAGLNFPVVETANIFIEGRANRAFRDNLFALNDNRTDALAFVGLRVALR